MDRILEEFRRNPLFWLLLAVPAVFLVEWVVPTSQSLLFVLSILAIVPLAALLSRATEEVAERTGDTVGGLINATLGNLVELLIAFTALRAGEYLLVKATLAGVIVTNSLFMLGICFLVGGLRHHLQEFNATAGRMQALQLFLATIALLVPSAVSDFDAPSTPGFVQTLSLCLAVLLIATYVLGLVFSLGTHPELFRSTAQHESPERPWPLGLALGMLAAVTVLVALTSEVFIASLEAAAHAFGLNRAFVGFVVVALVGGAAEMTAAISAARKNRLDMSVGIALGSATQIALFVAPLLVLASYVVGPTPMDLTFWPGAVLMMLVATMISYMACNTGRSAWFSGFLVLAVYTVFALTLLLLPPRAG